MPALLSLLLLNAPAGAQQKTEPAAPCERTVTKEEAQKLVKEGKAERIEDLPKVGICVLSEQAPAVVKPAKELPRLKLRSPVLEGGEGLKDALASNPGGSGAFFDGSGKPSCGDAVVVEPPKRSPWGFSAKLLGGAGLTPTGVVPGGGALVGVSAPLFTDKAGRVGLDAGGIVSVAPMRTVEGAVTTEPNPINGSVTETHVQRRLPGYTMTEFLGLYYQTPRFWDVVKLEIGGRLGYRASTGPEDVARETYDRFPDGSTQYTGSKNELVQGGPDSWSGLYPAGYGAVEMALGRDAAKLWSRFLLRFEVSHAGSFQNDGRDVGGVTFRGGLTFSTR